MTELILNGVWRLRRDDEESWYDAPVPGSVVQALLEAGKIDDPFYRDNETEALKLADHNYVYQRTFTVSTDLLQSHQVVLHCEGLDTLAVIELNGQTMASTDNMHRTYEFDVLSLLHEGENILQVHFLSPVKYIQELQSKNPLWGPDASVGGFPHIRKAHYMFGWDWGPQIPDAGIWRNISLRGYQHARLDDVLIQQVHKEGTVTLDIQVNVQQWGNSPIFLDVTLTHPNGSTEVFSQLIDGSGHRLEVAVRSPQLWWPNGYGEQPLYFIRTAIRSGKDVLDQSENTLGLRTLTVNRQPDQWGETFEFVVNGVDIFAKGANYIPEDNLVGRMNPARTQKLLEDCVAANFNLIRVWGGGLYPDKNFYDLCDRMGLIVWQDFMFACGVYDMTDEFAANIRQEAIDNIRRMRHHASLGLLCGNNEMEVGWVDWDFPKTEKLRADYVQQFEVLLKEVARTYAPQTFYWPASPSSGGGFDNPNDENRGDVHYWDVWHGRKPFTEYRKFFLRFCSEFGFQSFPSMKTIASYTLPEDRNPFSRVMEMHQKDHSANGKILWYLSDYFRYPKDLTALVYVSQVMQAEAIKYGVEHWRRNRGRSMGSIYWQLNDTWPVTSWSSIDGEGRWKALHYFAKRFYAPVLASACEEGTHVSLHVTNDTLDTVEGTMFWYLAKHGGEEIQSGTLPVRVSGRSAAMVAELDFIDTLASEKEATQTSLVFRFEPVHGIPSEGTVQFCRPKHFDLLKPNLTFNIHDEGESLVVELESFAFAKYVFLDLVQDDCIFSDNFFDLVPGHVKQIRVHRRSLSRELTKEEFSSQMRIQSLYDSYAHE